MLGNTSPAKVDNTHDEVLDRFLTELDDRIDVPAARARAVPAIAPLLLSEQHPATLEPELLMRHCTLRRGRSSGPGGQNRNKVETLVELTHGPTGLRAHAGERRTSAENRRVALRRLRIVLAVLVRSPVADGESTSERWRARVAPRGKRAGQITINPEHDDFPALLSEALDMLWRHELDQKVAALRLNCTPTQLIRFVGLCAPAWSWVNAHRTQRGHAAWKP